MSLDCFSKTYFEARDRFRQAATELHADLESYFVGTSPSGDLSIDVAVFGDRESESAMVVSSGCHGVEGFFGSATQLSWVKRLVVEKRNLTQRCVLIHAINPYGFANLRRCNEENVDLNRNFLMDDAAYTGAPERYAELNGFLNPESPPSSFEPFALKAAWKIFQLGKPALKAAVAGGQYEFPKGLFFGGKGPSRSMAIIRQNLQTWIGPSTTIVHIDLHSGLGEFGCPKLLLIDRKETEAFQWFSGLFGDAQVEPPEKPDVAYPVKGILGEWMRSHLAPRRYRFAAAEFGTHKLVRVLGAIRAENRAHFFGSPDSSSTHKAKAELLECFCPTEPSWRERVVKTGIDIIETCIRSI